MSKFNISNIGFIYGFEPSGHSVVARAISEFLPKDKVSSHFFEISDIFPKAARFFVKSYFEIIQKTPTLWGYLYDNPILSFLHKNFGIAPPVNYTHKIEKNFVKHSVELIVSTHAFSSIIADRRSMKIKIKKHVGVITDIYAHSFWPSNLDMYFVPHYETYKSLVLNGVNPDKIEVVGMPLRKNFYVNYNISAIRRRLKVGNGFVFLITGGSKGLGDIMSVIDVIKDIHNIRMNILVMCGLNKKLFRDIKKMRYLGGVKLVPLSYQQNDAIFYAASDCVIGKPGGVTIFEVAAFGKPFIAWGTLPGQEEKNLDFLKRHNCVISPKNKRELKESIISFVSGKDHFKKIAYNISLLHRKDASVKIAKYILENLSADKNL